MRQPRGFYEADSLHTEVYDALAASLLASSPLGSDVDFYRSLAAETGGPILDVGCGTGRVTMALAAEGHEVVGVDVSAPMLRLAERRREALPADVAARLSFHHADMAALDLGREFALILTPGRVFQFALTTDAQRQALASLLPPARPRTAGPGPVRPTARPRRPEGRGQRARRRAHSSDDRKPRHVGGHGAVARSGPPAHRRGVGIQ